MKKYILCVFSNTITAVRPYICFINIYIFKTYLPPCNNEIIHSCIDEQNNKYDNKDIVDCSDVLDLKQVCKEGISRHELFFWQTLMFARFPGNKRQPIYQVYTMKSPI
jgi:hypothetical protein